MNWAIARGGGEIRKEAALRRLQENPAAASSVLDEVYQLLLDRLWGTASDPATGRPEPDEFEGSDNARGRAVFELSDRWPTLQQYFAQTLTNLFQGGTASPRRSG